MSPIPVSNEKANSFQPNEEKVSEKDIKSETIVNKIVEKADAETTPPVAEVEKPLLKCMDLEQQTTNDVSDSQICNIDESTLIQENTNLSRLKFFFSK